MATAEGGAGKPLVWTAVSPSRRQYLPRHASFSELIPPAQSPTPPATPQKLATAWARAVSPSWHTRTASCDSPSPAPFSHSVVTTTTTTTTSTTSTAAAPLRSSDSPSVVVASPRNTPSSSSLAISATAATAAADAVAYGTTTTTITMTVSGLPPEQPQPQQPQLTRNRRSHSERSLAVGTAPPTVLYPLYCDKAATAGPTEGDSQAQGQAHVQQTSPATAVLRVFVPEVRGTRAVMFRPWDTVKTVREQLSKGLPSGTITPAHTLALPLEESSPHIRRSFWLDPDRFMCTYGIDTEPSGVLILSVRRSPEKFPLLDMPPFLTEQIDQQRRRGIEEISPWMELMATVDEDRDEWRQRCSKLARRVPVPECLRGSLWARLTGAHWLMHKNRGIYPHLVAHHNRQSSPDGKAPEESPYSRKIRVDLSRTMPDHRLFRSEEGQTALSNVLHAYALFDSEVGYCQGINFLAAQLLTRCSEEVAFWSLVQLLRKYGMRDFFTSGVPLLRTCLDQFERVLAQALPDVTKHLERESVPIEAFATPWFHTVFVGTDLPPSLKDGVWDWFLMDGLPVLFRVALSLLKLSKHRILRSECSDLMMLLHFNPASWDSSAVTPSLLVQTSAKLSKRFTLDDALFAPSRGGDSSPVFSSPPSRSASRKPK